MSKKQPNSPKKLIREVTKNSEVKSNEFLKPAHKANDIATLMDMGYLEKSGLDENSFLSGWQKNDPNSLIKMHLSEENNQGGNNSALTLNSDSKQPNKAFKMRKDNSRNKFKTKAFKTTTKFNMRKVDRGLPI
jgi:hypothetical protein